MSRSDFWSHVAHKTVSSSDLDILVYFHSVTINTISSIRPQSFSINAYVILEKKDEVMC